MQFRRALGGLSATRVIDQNTAHFNRREREEVVAVVPIHVRPGPQHPDVRFVDKGRGFQSVIRALSPHQMRRPRAQVVVDQAKQVGLGCGITGTDAAKK